MTGYTITANGTEMGVYEGATEREAIEAYARDAGYESVASAAERLGQTEADFLAEIEAIAVPMRTITLSDGRKLQYQSDAAYEAAEAWYNDFPHGKQQMIHFCVARGADLFTSDGAELVPDWADIAMHCWAKSKGLAA